MALELGVGAFDDELAKVGLVAFDLFGLLRNLAFERCNEPLLLELFTYALRDLLDGIGFAYPA